MTVAPVSTTPTPKSPAADIAEHAGAAASIAPTGLIAPPSGLRLVSLTLTGFKSFADTTTFTFDDPITGVVGPNGCGKSNLVDAVKWVLGERSSKSLRGKEMIDVIFAGSAGRKPGGMASVTLTFSNPVIENAPPLSTDPTDPTDPTDAPLAIDDEHDDDTSAETTEATDADTDANSDAMGEVTIDRRRVRRPLPIDAEEVAVERQLFRDGTSRYVINGKRARLRDIRDLFLDTGIGADAYSIIEQGKVDAMLLASPQERRTIFEEAAGVAKYKLRRIEASRKLERTETNLVRTRDQLESTERRLKTVRTQAAKARRFQELDDENRALKLAVAFQQYDEVRVTLNGLTSQLQQLTGERDATQRAVTELESDKRDADAARSEADTELRSLEQSAADARHQAEQAEQRAAMAARSIEEAEKAIETETARHAEASKAATDLQADAADAADELAALAEKLADAERSLESLNTARADATRHAAEARRALAESRSTLEKIERDRARVEAQAESRRREAEQLAVRTDRLAARATELAQTLAAVRTRITETQAAHSDAEAAVAAAERTTGDLNARAGDLAADRQGQLDALNTLERELAGADAKRSTLDELVRTRAGLGEAARAALDTRDAGQGFAGVIAPLAELIETDGQHAAVVETALGDLLDALVVRTPIEMPTRAELDTLPGRVRLAVLADPSSADEGLTEADAVLLSARVQRVRSLVRTRPDAPQDLGALLDRVLGSCLVVGDLDAAQMLRAGGLGRARFVTRSGETLDTDGTLTAGPSDQAADGAGEGRRTGVLARAAELTELEATVADLNTRVNADRARLVATDERLGQIQSERSDAERTLASARGDAAKLASTLEREQAELSRGERDLASVKEEAGELDEQKNAVDTGLEDLVERARRFEGLADEHRAAVATHETTVADAVAAAEESGDALAKARVEVGRLGEQTAASRREARRLENEVESAKRRAGEHERHVADARERRDRHAETVATARTTAEDNRALATKLAGESKAVGERVGEMTARSESVGRDLGAARDRARLVERDWNALESSRREQEVRREHLEERAHDDIGVDLAGEYLDYRVTVAPGDVTPVDVPDAQARINVLRTEIKKLGNVNIDAIAEEDTLAEKNEELVVQLADIDEARVLLVELIEKLNEASKARFGEVFARIQAHFGGQDGMFRKLFGGGRAEVRLMPLVKEVDGRKVVTDEVDLLESGIEVIAKPPGKEPRSISQLSGGEKTLTAVALLMSIFRSKPSCFCVLDEVDAALDEANVARFGSVVREFTSFSRFIVITHNKRTMQICDHLYGVTQRERGVSSRVSVKFDQVGSDGTVSAEAVSAEAVSAEAVSAEAVKADRAGQAAQPDKPKPSASLRAALGKMREGDGPVEVDAGSETNG